MGQLLEFGDFRVDPAQKLLFRGDDLTPLTPKAFDTLLALLEADGRIVEKDELLKKVWPDSFVEEGSLARNISMLRKALGESPDDQKYIQTIPKRGYRFVAAVVTKPGDAAPAEPESTPSSSRRIHKLRIAALAAALATLGTVGWVSHRQLARGGATPSVQSIAVLPLENLSRDASQEYFADGVTDAIITALAQIRDLKVISRTSIMRYKGSTKGLPEIASELGVQAILEGSVQREGGRVRVTVQLIEAATDSHLWAESYERDVGDMLRLQGNLAMDVANRVHLQVSAATRQRFNRSPNVSPAAQDEFLLARQLQDRRDSTHLEQAVRHFENAIRREPDFAAAYAGLADAWVQRGVLGGFGFREAEAPARKAAIRALELDPGLAQAHAALAHILWFYDMAWVTAEQEYRRAIELEPSNVPAHVYYASLLEILGRFSEGLAEGRRSLELDPVSVTVNSEYGRVLYRARRYEEAIRQYERTLELEPDSPGVRARLVEAYQQSGRTQEALAAALETFRTLQTPLWRAHVARAYAMLGRREEARAMLAGAEPAKPAVLPYAMTYFVLGDLDQGFELLTKAFDDRQYVSLIACDPKWDIVRDDPRFRALIRRLGLPER